MAKKRDEWAEFECRTAKYFQEEVNPKVQQKNRYTKKIHPFQVDVDDFHGAYGSGANLKLIQQRLDLTGNKHQNSNHKDTVCPLVTAFASGGIQRSRLELICDFIENDPTWLFDPCVQNEIAIASALQEKEVFESIAKALSRVVPKSITTKHNYLFRRFIIGLHNIGKVNIRSDDLSEFKVAHTILKNILINPYPILSVEAHSNIKSPLNLYKAVNKWMYDFLGENWKNPETLFYHGGSSYDHFIFPPLNDKVAIEVVRNALSMLTCKSSATVTMRVPEGYRKYIKQKFITFKVTDSLDIDAELEKYKNENLINTNKIEKNQIRRRKMAK